MDKLPVVPNKSLVIHYVDVCYFRIALILSFCRCLFLVGLPNTSGLICRKGVASSSDADVIVALRRAGAIPIAVTNVSELCMWYESSNLVYGRSNNAYHQGRIVGGSSGRDSRCQILAAFVKLNIYRRMRC